MSSERRTEHHELRLEQRGLNFQGEIDFEDLLRFDVWDPCPGMGTMFDPFEISPESEFFALAELLEEDEIIKNWPEAEETIDAELVGFSSDFGGFVEARGFLGTRFSLVRA